MVDKVLVFKTLKKSKRLILRQPFIIQERHKTGTKKGKVKAKRKAQYCEGLNTLFMDEQKSITETPERTNQYFKNGYLKVEENDVLLVQALREHEDNKENGGNIFKEIDVESEELYEIEQLEKTDEVKALLANSSDNTIRTAGVWYYGMAYIHKTVPSIKLRLREDIDRSQQEKAKYKFRDSLTEFLKSKDNEVKLITVIALKEEVIAIRNGKSIIWGDSGELIFTSSQNKFVIKEFVNFLTIEESGKQIQGHIADKINEVLEE